MGILAWIVVGVIAGVLSGIVVRGRGFGLAGDIIVGVAGALIGGWLAGFLFTLPNAVNGINLESILVAFAGSVVLLLVIRLFRGQRSVG